MNETIQLLQSHKTIRHFDPDYTLASETLHTILDAARQAPSWMNGQTYSIIVIDDPKIRQQLVTWNPGNPHILQSSVFLLFVADLKRTQLVADHYQVDYQVTRDLQPLIVSTIDASLALENAVIATESLHLGCVVVGSVQKDAKKISTLLNLPDYCLPIAGLSIGKPAIEMRKKPRLPKEAVIHYNTYQPYDYQLITDYDKTMEEFGEARETKLWSKKFADYYQGSGKPDLTNFLRSQKLID